MRLAIRNQKALKWILCLLSGLLFFLSSGLHPVFWLAWFAAVPVLLCALLSGSLQSFLFGFIAYTIGSLNLLTYLMRLSPIGVVILLVPGIIFGLVLWFSNWSFRRTNSTLVFLIVFSCSWTTYEFLLSQSGANGTALSWAYYQIAFIAVIQIASLTGFLGITFLQTLVVAAIATTLYYYFFGEKNSRAFYPLMIVAAVFFLVLLNGIMIIHKDGNREQVKGALISVGENNMFLFTKNKDTALKLISSYIHEIDKLHSQGIDVVVLPEKIVGVTDDYADTAKKIFSDCAQRNQMMIVAGINRMKRDSLLNEAWVFDTNGNMIANYHKRFFVPGLEVGYTPGNIVTILPQTDSVYAIQICKDMDFPEWSQQYGKRHAGVMLIPAWDFVVDGYLHSRMAVLRGVENGFAEMRSAQDGNLTFSDAHGRIIAETTSGHTTPSVLVASISPGDGNTFYSLYGNWLGWLTFVVLIAIIIYAWFKKPIRIESH